MLLLLFAVVAAPVLAFWPDGEQDPDQWQKHVKNACEARRYGTRLAAARRVAAAGAAAVPAIKAYSHKKGRNAVPISLVDLIANSKTTSPETVVLLQAWAEDLDFPATWAAAIEEGLRGEALSGPRFGFPLVAAHIQGVGLRRHRERESETAFALAAFPENVRTDMWTDQADPAPAMATAEQGKIFIERILERVSTYLDEMIAGKRVKEVPPYHP